MTFYLIKENQLKDLEIIVNNLRQNQNSDALNNESYLYYKRSKNQKIKEVEKLIGN